jgi:hypothetical protein
MKNNKEVKYTSLRIDEPTRIRIQKYINYKESMSDVLNKLMNSHDILHRTRSRNGDGKFTKKEK